MMKKKRYFLQFIIILIILSTIIENFHAISGTSNCVFNTSSELVNSSSINDYQIINISKYDTKIKTNNLSLDISQIQKVEDKKFMFFVNITAEINVSNIVFTFHLDYEAISFNVFFWKEPEKWYKNGEWINIDNSSFVSRIIDQNTILEIPWESINNEEYLRLKIEGTYNKDGDTAIVIFFFSLFVILGLCLVSYLIYRKYKKKKKSNKLKKEKKGKTKSTFVIKQEPSIKGFKKYDRSDKRIILFKDKIPINLKPSSNSYSDTVFKILNKKKGEN